MKRLEDCLNKKINQVSIKNSRGRLLYAGDPKTMPAKYLRYYVLQANKGALGRPASFMIAEEL